MNWLQRNYDKALLAGVAFVCLPVSATILPRAMSFTEDFAVDPVKTFDSGPSIICWSGTPSVFRLEELPIVTWSSTVSLFDSPELVLNQGHLVDLSEPGRPLHPPVPNEWLREHGLNLLSANILREDADGEGFTNLEEWAQLTDPRDPKSHPSYLEKLSYVERKQASFFLRFATSSHPDFQINYRPGHIPAMASVRTKLNEEFLGRFTITKYEPKDGMDGLVKRDKSELTVNDKQTGKSFVLVHWQDLNWPDFYARFLFEPDRSEFLVREGDTFELSPQPGHSYKLLEAGESQVVIQDGEEKVVRPLLPPVRN